MGSVAGLLQLSGHEVRGSDEHVYPPMSTQLAALGIEVMPGFSADNLAWGPDLVVVGNVCRKDHVEAVAAVDRGIPVTSFPAVLEEHFLADRHSVVVAGTHGKTTCASLLSWLLLDAGRDPSCFVGGVPLNLGRSFRLGKGPHAVVEGDEYDTAYFDKGSKFLHYRPRSVLLTGVEFDHADIFADLEAVKAAFLAFLRLVPPDGLVLVWRGCEVALGLARQAAEERGFRLESYGVEDDRGEEEKDTWTGRIVGNETAATTLELFQGEVPFGRLRTSLSGLYNLRNVVGCAALAHHLGLGASELASSVLAFRGVKRRQQVRGVALGVTVIDDFAHHPTAVRETLAGLRGRYQRGRLFAAFEPRSASSRRAVFQEAFGAAFGAADEVVVGRPYDQSRLDPSERLDPERLVEDIRRRGIPAYFIPEPKDIVTYFASRVRPGDAVVVMSSGAFGNLHRLLLEHIGDAVTPTESEDLPGLEALFARVGLENPRLVDELDQYIVLRSVGGLAGCVGLERQGRSGLLKDLAVIPERRGEGLAWMLAEAAVREAARQGISRLYMIGIPETLRTGQNLGFDVVECTELDEALRSSATFSSSWYCKTGVCLRLDLE